MKIRMKMLLVDDHPVFRRGLREIIGENTGFGIVGAAADGAIGLRMAAEL